MIKKLFLLIYSITIFPLAAQIRQQGQEVDESQLYATTKQVNQFIKRFNGEEDTKGNKLYEGDRMYRNEKLRKQYMSMLFDHSSNISEEQQLAFGQAVVAGKQSQFLDFHESNWFAELNAVFVNSQGKEENIILFLKLEQQREGYAWVMFKAANDRYKKLFQKDTAASRKFIHPMSHELDFMNLNKAFREGENMDYTSDDYHPDHLSILLYELQKQQLKFKTVQSVNFHFFQVEGWYFQISEYNRAAYNNGWLISDLTPIKVEDIPVLKAFIYDEH
jgi:hypothetical protein